MPAAFLPCGVSLGATWDVDLMEQIGQLLAEEVSWRWSHLVTEKSRMAELMGTSANPSRRRCRWRPRCVFIVTLLVVATSSPSAKIRT